MVSDESYSKQLFGIYYNKTKSVAKLVLSFFMFEQLICMCIRATFALRLYFIVIGSRKLSLAILNT